MDKPHVKEVIIVEGTYDRNNLSQAVDAEIIETKGFGIFNNPKMRSYIKTSAEERGIVILTDSDSAGKLIRNSISGFVQPEKIKNAYIPVVFGKEKRKAKPGKEGKLGVEGMKREVLLSVLREAGATINGKADERCGDISHADFYNFGFIGRNGSAEKRKAFLMENNLPDNLSVTAMLKYINRHYTTEDFTARYGPED